MGEYDTRSFGFSELFFTPYWVVATADFHRYCIWRFACNLLLCILLAIAVTFFALIVPGIAGGAIVDLLAVAAIGCFAAGLGGLLGLAA